MKKRIMATAIATVVVVSGLGAAQRVWPCVNADSGGSEYFGITYPTHDSYVDETDVRGISGNIPAELTRWIMVFVPEIGRYYPQDYPIYVHSNGDWHSLAYVGSEWDAGKPFFILSVLADPAAHNELIQYIEQCRQTGSWPGLAALPWGAVEYDSVYVIRKPAPMEITSPSDGSPVEMCEDIAGTIADFDGDEDRLWIVVFSPEVNRYYPQDSDVILNLSQWYSHACIGLEGDTGKEFEIVLIFADPEAHIELTEYIEWCKIHGIQPGLVMLPEGAAVYDSIAVIRI